MITTKLPQIESGFKDKHICPFAEELKSIRNQLNDIAGEYGSYSADLQISVYGQSTMFHVTAMNIQTLSKVEAVGNNLEILEENFRKELQKDKEGSYTYSFFDSMFKETIEAFNNLSIRK